MGGNGIPTKKDFLRYNAVFGLNLEGDVETLNASKLDIEWTEARDRRQDDQLGDYG